MSDLSTIQQLEQIYIREAHVNDPDDFENWREENAEWAEKNGYEIDENGMMRKKVQAEPEADPTPPSETGLAFGIEDFSKSPFDYARDIMFLIKKIERTSTKVLNQTDRIVATVELIGRDIREYADEEVDMMANYLTILDENTLEIIRTSGTQDALDTIETGFENLLWKLGYDVDSPHLHEEAKASNMTPLSIRIFDLVPTITDIVEGVQTRANDILDQTDAINDVLVELHSLKGEDRRYAMEYLTRLNRIIGRSGDATLDKLDRVTKALGHLTKKVGLDYPDVDDEEDTRPIPF